MAVVRLFASAREAAGRTSDQIDAPTVGAVLDEACRRYGDRFSAVLGTSKVWVNGQPAEPSTPVLATDVVAVLPPVSGGSAVPQAPAPPPPSTATPTAATPTAATPTAATPTAATPAPATPASGPVRPVAKPVAFGPAGPRAARPPAPVHARPKPPIVRGNLALVPDPEPEPGPDADAQPSPSPGNRATPQLPPLAVVHNDTRPHGRLGLAWATVTVGLTVAGPGWLAAWMAVAGLVAATQTAAVWRKRGERPVALAAGAIAAGIPLAASVGIEAVNGAVVAGVFVTLVARVLSPTKAPSRDVALTLVIGVALGLAAASPVLMRHAGITPALLLLGFVAVYDAGAYLVGTGAASVWEGPAAGVAALVPLTIFAAVILIPPFTAGEPLVLGLLAGALAPIGPVAGSALLGDGIVDAPGLRRLDALLVLGPIWTWCALIFLR